MRTTLLALAAILAAGQACSQSAPVKISVTLVEPDASADASDASDGAPAEVPMARCCVLQVADAGGGDAAVTDSCAILARNGLGASEPCLTSNAGGTYGRWTCGAGADAAQNQCDESGLSCSVGEPCTLVDVGCPGVVQACAFTPFTPPPG